MPNDKDIFQDSATEEERRVRDMAEGSGLNNGYGKIKNSEGTDAGQDFMRTRQVLPLVLSMSLPMVLSMAVNALYNIVDSFFVAKISEEAMTALSIVYPLQNLVNAAAIGFGVGAGAAISVYLGAGKADEADREAVTSLRLSLLHGIVLAAVCIIGAKSFISCFTSDPDIISSGVIYAFIVLLFSPVITVTMVTEKLFQSAGRMTETMLSMLAGCVTNIILDPLMIFGIGIFPEMGISGAALATGIGQAVSLIIYAVINVYRSLPVRFSFLSERVSEGEKGNDRIIFRLYAVGVPAALNLALPSLMISALNAILAAWGSAYVLVLGAYYKLQTFLYLPANGIIQGIRPLVGYNYGAGESARVKKISRVTFTLSALIMAVGMLLSFLIPEKLIGLFTENAVTIENGMKALHIICFGFVFSAVSVTVSGVLEGIGKGRESLMISLTRYIVVILPAAFILSRFLGPNGVWHAFWITETAAALLSVYLRRNF